MAVCYEHAIVTRQNFGQAPIDNARHPDCNVGQLLTWCNARWYQILPNHPISIIEFCADFCGGSALPRTVIPFQKIVGVTIWL